MSKIVELTTGNTAICQPMYPEEEIELLNPFLYVGTPLPYEDGELGGLFTHWILNRVPYGYTQGVLKDWARCLKANALLYVIVPSFEWLAREVLQERMSPYVRPLLFGTQKDEYSTGMNALTMYELRLLFDEAGLKTVKARVGKMDIEIGDEIFEIEQHQIVGVKNEN